MCKVKIIINTKQTQQPLQKWLIDVNLKVTSTKIKTSENVAFNTLFEIFSFHGRYMFRLWDIQLFILFIS